MKIFRLLTVASAAFFFASAALAQNAGTVTSRAFAIGKGAGQAGLDSVLCTQAQIAIGQNAAKPICAALSGDITMDAAGVTAIGTAKVTSAMLRNSGALSVIGRSANSSGVPGDISCTAASDGVLRESGSVLGCGTVATAGIANNAVTDAKLRQSAALSLVGRSANSTGNVADISAVAASSCAFRESGSTIGCGTLATAALANNAVTDAKLRQGVARSVIGVTGNATANVADIQGATDQVLRVNGAGTALAFGAIDLSKAAAATGVIQATSFPAMTGDVTSSAGALATTIAANAVTNAKMATMAAYTFKGNNTGSSATPTDVDIATLTTKASPAAGDYIMLSDQAASGAWKKATVSSVASAGSVSSINGQTGAITSYFPPQGRLTLQTGNAVMTSTQSAKTTIYYTPYVGNMVPLYDGTNMVPTVVAEISVATTDTAKNPAAIGASKVNDWFVWNDAGTIRLSHGPDWTNDTTRSAGTALTLVNGIYLNNASITNGPAASRGTYVGTTRSNGSSQLDHIIGGAASGGTAAFLGVRNYYNRVLTAVNVVDSGATYTYTSTTIRQARASAGNQITFISFGDDAIDVAYVTENSLINAANGFANAGIGLDTTSAYSSPRSLVYNPVSTANMVLGGAAVYRGVPNSIGIGAHFVSGNEASDGTNAQVFNNNAKNTLSLVIMN